MSNQVKVLDHGYVAWVEAWGSDMRVIEDARMSTGKGFLGWEPGECPTCEGEGCLDCSGRGTHPGDAKLLKYLWTNDPPHSTPFEGSGATFEIMAPIMVFREWHRHRTQSYNEASARYAPLPDLNYVPGLDRCMRDAGKNKQAGAAYGADQLTRGTADHWRMLLISKYKECEDLYQYGLKIGIPKELARLILPVGRYSRMRASANLLNWIKFLKLRYHGKAQWEICAFAKVVKDLLSERFPRVMALVNLPEVDL